jgi:3-oxoacyl-[acyl-carrier protein] reductase
LDDDSVAEFVNYIKAEHKIDILVNNAGINVIEGIDRLKKENWDDIIKVNLSGPMTLVKELCGNMKKKRWGRILNISSIWGVVGKEKRNSYAASKTGLIGLTRSLALDLAPYNILVNALCPGFTSTELTSASLSKSEMNKLSSEIPLKRFARVDEIAKSAIFLCSSLNSYITGQHVVVDGGYTIR